MSFEIKCDRCKKELKELGALAFSPPEEGQCYKFHLCVSCWPRVLRIIDMLGDADQYIEMEANQWHPGVLYADRYPNSYLAINCETKMVEVACQDKDEFIKKMAEIPASVMLALCDTFDHIK